MFHTLRAGVQYIRSWKSAWNQQLLVALQTPLLLRRLRERADQTLKRFGKSSSLQWKKIFGSRLMIFCEWRHKWSNFLDILAHVTWPRAQPADQSTSLKVSLETWLESESFEPLINFFVFVIQKLGFKIKLINQIFLLLYIITSEPETLAGHPKYQKTHSLAWFQIKTWVKILPSNVLVEDF